MIGNRDVMWMTAEIRFQAHVASNLPRRMVPVSPQEAHEIVTG